MKFCLYVQSHSCVQLFVTLWTSTHQASLSSTLIESLLKLIISTESVMPSNHLILFHPFSSCPQTFPASWSFPVSQLFTSGGQSFEASVSAPVLPMNIQGWFPLELRDLLFFLSRGLSRVFSRTTVWKHQFFGAEHFYGPTLISVHDYWKTVALTIWTFASEVMCLFFNMLSGFVIAFLPRSKHLLISWL